ncbi:MAG: type I phosphomannose isomerase catalytic subunit [Planctomycetota bacterium]|jgi:mannose-6-phosphate isomerase
MDPVIYPYLQQPVFRKKIWGGRRFATMLGKNLPGSGPYGESWELAADGGESSVIANGPLAGRPLGEVSREIKTGLIGRRNADRFDSFPLLLKFIDASDILSVQVHPDDECAARTDDAGASCKTEAWYVLDAEPESRIILGVKEGTSRESFAKLLDEGRLEECLNSFPVNKGDVIYVPAGTVHAVGKGVLLYEIQECSDTTYRVYDWNRSGLDGKPRELHVPEALEAIHYEPPGANVLSGSLEGMRFILPGTDVLEDAPVEKEYGTVALRVRCRSFVLAEFDLTGPAELDTEGEVFHIVTAIEGAADIEWKAGSVPLALGQTVLIPAALHEYAIRPDGQCRVLASSLP